MVFIDLKMFTNEFRDTITTAGFHSRTFILTIIGPGK